MSEPTRKDEIITYLENVITSREGKFGERELDILRHRVFPTKKTKTLKNIGDKWGVSRQRIEQLEKRLRGVLELATNSI